MRMSIIEEQTENVIIESDPDEPDNQPIEHPNGQLCYFPKVIESYFSTFQKAHLKP